MKIYELLSRVPFLKRYSFKFLFVAFLGIHIPLLAVIGFILFQETDTFSGLSIFLIVLGFTLFATAITLFTLNGLLSPLINTKESLELYAADGRIPNLPAHYTDEAGILMRDVQHTITKTEKMLDTQKSLISLLSHDMRTPLAEIIGVSQVLDLASDPAEKESLIRQITTSGNSMLEMLESVLTLMRLETMEANSYPKTHIALYTLAKESVSNLQNRFDQKKLQVILDVPTDLQVLVNANAFSHVLTNLLHNAAKFSYQKGIIHLSATKSQELSVIQIQDTGVGLESGMAEYIFNRFTKHGRPGTENEKSTGLGLFLTREIVEKHQGRIYAQSDGKDHGTTFTIELPA